MGQIVVLLRGAPGPTIDPITAPRRHAAARLQGDSADVRANNTRSADDIAATSSTTVRFLSAEKPRVHNRLSAATGSLEQRTVRRDRVCGHRGLPVVRRDERNRSACQQ